MFLLYLSLTYLLLVICVSVLNVLLNDHVSFTLWQFLLYISGLRSFQILKQISTFLSLPGRRLCLFKHSFRVVAHLLASGALPCEFSLLLEMKISCLQLESVLGLFFISIFSVSAGCMIESPSSNYRKEEMSIPSRDDQNISLT